MKPLSVNESRAEDIEKIIGIDDGQIAALLIDMDDGDISIGADGLIEKFDKNIGVTVGRKFLSHVSSLSRLCDDECVKFQDVIKALRSGLERFGWDEEKISRFDRFAPNFQKLHENRKFYIISKSIQLFAASGHHLHQLKVYTDARPIFDSKRGQVLGMLLFSTLGVISSDAAEAAENLTIALRYDDLKKIREEIDRAIAKMEHLENCLRGEQRVDVLVYGRGDA